MLKYHIFTIIYNNSIKIIVLTVIQPPALFKGHAEVFVQQGGRDSWYIPALCRSEGLPRIEEKTGFWSLWRATEWRIYSGYRCSV